MSIWVGVAVLVVLVVLVVAVPVARRGRDSRAARRELRQLRTESGRTVNAAEIARQRRALQTDPLFPGSSGGAGGI